MKMVFVSNYFNHHQMSLSDELYSMLGKNNFLFVETENMSEERKKLGWQKITRPYVLKLSHSNIDIIRKNISNADVLIAGSAPFSLIKERIKANKMIFIYSERIFKKRIEYFKYFKRFFRFRWYGKSNVYLLCASAYAKLDYSLFFKKTDNTFKWGYFPQIKKYNSIDKMINQKKENAILWVGRFIKWKHAEIAIRCARYLKKKGLLFTLKLVGSGAKKQRLIRLISKCNLDGFVTVEDSMSPDSIRTLMEQSSIFLFTSNRQEGWGAVLNEAMNSGCAVVASHAAGSTPFLIKDGFNGKVFKSGNQRSINGIVEMLINNKATRTMFGKNAYETIIVNWSPAVAAKRLIDLVSSIVNKKPMPVFEDGPCTPAKLIKDNWYKEG